METWFCCLDAHEGACGFSRSRSSSASIGSAIDILFQSNPKMKFRRSALTLKRNSTAET
jgi:hypothetical protein